MSYFTFNGSPGSDYISSYDLNQTNPGYIGYIVYGLSGNDTISLSTVGRLGIDVAYGGNGDDYLYSHAYDSEYAVNLFGGGYGNDRVYFSVWLTPETTVWKAKIIRSQLGNRDQAFSFGWHNTYCSI